MRPQQLAKFLTFSLTNNLNVLVKGSPGAGKTSIITKVAQDLQYELIVSHPVVSDPTDYKGLPFAQDGRALFLPYGDLERLITADKPTIFFLDDLGQASTEVQKAIMHILLARHIGDHKISDHVRFVAATNRKSDKAGVTGILEPVKSRFASIVELDIHVDDWLDWAMLNDMPVELIGFVKFKPDILLNATLSNDMVNSVSPRTLAHVGAMQNAGIHRDMEREAFSGAAGEGFATEYLAFLVLCRDLPSIDSIIKHPQTTEVPRAIDTKYVLATTLGQHMSLATIDNIVTYCISST